VNEGEVRPRRILHFPTLRKASGFLCVSEATIFKQAAAGRIPSFPVGTCVRFDPRAVANCGSNILACATVRTRSLFGGNNNPDVFLNLDLGSCALHVALPPTGRNARTGRSPGASNWSHGFQPSGAAAILNGDDSDKWRLIVRYAYSSNRTFVTCADGDRDGLFMQEIGRFR
jgi:hypothetical protein